MFSKKNLLVILFIFFTFINTPVASGQTFVINWNNDIPTAGKTALPHLAYDSKRNQILVAWTDSRNDPGDNPDAIGPQSNDNIYGRILSASNGTIIGNEIPIADRGRYSNLEPARYDNETYVSPDYDPTTDKYVFSWQMISDETLMDAAMTRDPVTNLMTPEWSASSCHDVSFRTYSPASQILTPMLINLARIPKPVVSAPPYTFSCQQEPTVTILPGGKSLVLWHDLRDQKAKSPLNNNYQVDKDIFGQIFDNNSPVLNEPVNNLLYTEPSGLRNPLNQEMPQIAKGADRFLLVWTDARPTNPGVYGQFIDFSGQALGQNFSIMTSPVNDISKDGYLYRATVAYLPVNNVFVVSASERAAYTNSYGSNLVYAVVNANNGAISVAKKTLPGTYTRLFSYPKIACNYSSCLLVYRKLDSQNYKIFAFSLDKNYGSLGETILDSDPGYHDYPDVISDGIYFYAAYDSDKNNGSGNRLRVAKTTIGSPPVIACFSCSTGLPTSQGNANCDAKINSLDFALWKKVLENPLSTEEEKSMVDFNCQPTQTTHIVNLVDFILWSLNSF